MWYVCVISFLEQNDTITHLLIWVWPWNEAAWGLKSNYWSSLSSKHPIQHITLEDFTAFTSKWSFQSLTYFLSPVCQQRYQCQKYRTVYLTRSFCLSSVSSSLLCSCNQAAFVPLLWFYFHRIPLWSPNL